MFMNGFDSNVYELIWFELGMMVGTILPYISISWLTLTLIQGHRSSQICMIWMDFAVMLKLVSVMNLILILFFPFDI